MTDQEQFDSPLDHGIEKAVLALRKHGVETFESCEGGEGHAYPEPTVRFHGNHVEGFRALSAAMVEGLHVHDLRRTWPVIDAEPTGPYWELTFVKKFLPQFKTHSVDITGGVESAEYVRGLRDEES